MSNGGYRYGGYRWERPLEWSWDPAYWETRAGHWGPPGVHLTPALANKDATGPQIQIFVEWAEARGDEEK